jgi:hypothetical protein
MTNIAIDPTRRDAARLASFVAALPQVICCAIGAGVCCTHDPYGWGVCCAIRLRMVQAGLIPKPARPPQPDDGA